MFDQEFYDHICDAYREFPTLKNLKVIRNYLADVGLPMPMPKYEYREDDINTWKFLDGRVIENKRTGNFKYENVYNPNFKYGLLV